jgi:hypothetical protein
MSDVDVAARLTRSNCDESEEFLVRLADVGSLGAKRWRGAEKGSCNLAPGARLALRVRSRTA